MGIEVVGVRNIKHFNIPMLPVSKNVWHGGSRGSAMRRHRIKMDWEEQVWAGVNTAPRMPRRVASVKVHSIIYWNKRGVLPDHHNLDMLHECTADGLVKAGILKDDADGVYERGEQSLLRVTDDRAGSTDLIIEWR